MSSSTASPAKKKLASYLTLGLLESLSVHPNVRDIDFKLGDPVDKTDLVAWEQMYMCILPTDMKNFYLCCDGLTLNWSFKLRDREIVHLGHVNVNPLSSLRKVGGFIPTNADTPTLLDIDSDAAADDQHHLPTPSFGVTNKIFELDCCSSGADGGQVCLVYRMLPSDQQGGCQEWRTPSVWYLDQSFSWHFLARTFTGYFRLALAHLGLRKWLDLLTPYGLPEHTFKWYQMFAPLLTCHQSAAASWVSQSGFVVDRVKDEEATVKLDIARLRKELHNA